MATITKSDELRLHNRSRILSCLRQQGCQSRTMLGERTGLSAATVSQITADLIDDEILEMVAPVVTNDTIAVANTRRGRPQVTLQLRASAATAAVLTLFLNEMEVVLYDYSGLQIYNAKKSLNTISLSLEWLKKQMYLALDTALNEAGQTEDALKHISFVCQGTVTRDNDILLWSPITTLTNINLRSILQSRYSATVDVYNDCNTIARAMYLKRSAAGTTDSKYASSIECNNFAVILSSYGIGLGYFYQGDILTGSYSSGTEFGHMLFKADGALCRCGRRGCIEAYASDYAIWRRAKGLPSQTPPVDEVSDTDFNAMVAAAKRKPGPEREAFIEAGVAFGQGLSNLFAIFDPFPVMLVGFSPQAFELIQAPLAENLQHYGIEHLDDYVVLYNSASERELLHSGASILSLSYLDRHVFGFRDDAMLNLPVKNSPLAS